MNPATTSVFLGGRLQLAQPAKGHRAGTDAALLAACPSPTADDTVYDLGAGVGPAGLAVALRFPGCRVRLVEIDRAIAALARANVETNGLAARVDVLEADVTARLAKGGPLEPASAGHVIMNPPFHLAGTVRPPPDAYRSGAHIHGEEGDEAWIRCAHGLLRPKGMLALIHRADALPRLLAALDRRFGDIRVKPVLPRVDEPAVRILIRAQRESRAPFILLPPLVLHQADGSFTPEAEALHRGEGSVDWQA
ncbi:methyltransferase [Labrys miyagiensis]|uniref:Methyltransferase n=1 Tax=Labrys miyagiensis TaxID=346912 RepID=A0ABQ6CV28_9HYPH|nr:methyltransferase [Labrys miyagiensis]GLS22574.1 methyltransferase [Labrys miyagiensis]